MRTACVGVNAEGRGVGAAGGERVCVGVMKMLLMNGTVFDMDVRES